MAQSRLTQRRLIIILLIGVVAIIAWSPWITDEYAVTLVVDSLGGPDGIYDYLGTPTPLSDVPKTVVRVPFAILVYFPSEAMYIVTFWGTVL
jgi:hypothetical protein